MSPNPARLKRPRSFPKYSPAVQKIATARVAQCLAERENSLAASERYIAAAAYYEKLAAEWKSAAVQAEMQKGAR